MERGRRVLSLRRENERIIQPSRCLLGKHNSLLLWQLKQDSNKGQRKRKMPKNAGKDRK